MSEKRLMTGNEAIGEGAIKAGCRHFFGYPITPQNELPAYMARRMEEVGGVFLQAESELAAISMVYGAAGAGARVMTSSSSPGISLKQEGISYLAGTDLPCVIVNIMRGGPGLGGIQPAQADYFQATRGGGHGDYRLVVLAPATVQEAYRLTGDAFNLADRYRMPVMIVGDGMLGQMMEPVALEELEIEEVARDWAVGGGGGEGDRERNVLTSLCLDTPRLERMNWERNERYNRIRESEVRFETYRMDDADLALVAYGTTARIARGAIDAARQEDIRAGLIRPITLWPFPEDALREYGDRVGRFLVVELSTGQMVEDVRLALNDPDRIEFFGRTGGMVPEEGEVLGRIREIDGRGSESDGS